MEQLRDLGMNRTGIGIVCFIATRIVLTFLDILCVGAYFGIILSLIYFTFLKDGLEILIYAVAKITKRFKWLYRIFKIQEFLCINLEMHERESSIITNPDESISVQSSSCLVKNSTDVAASSSRFSGSQYNSQLFTHSQSKTSVVEEANGSSVVFESPRSSKSGSPCIPRKLSSLSTQIISSTDNFNIDETDFEDVDLSDEKNEVHSMKTSTEELNLKQNSSKWNIARMKIFDSFRRNKATSSDRVKTHMENLAEKVAEILPKHADDNDKLFHEINDRSPVQSGCCTSLPHILQSKYKMRSIASYARF